MALGRKSTLRRILTVDLPMVLILVFTLGPYLWMALTSLTAEDKLFTRGPSVFDLVWETTPGSSPTWASRATCSTA